jgi:enterochelin esterase-like enzyme
MRALSGTALLFLQVGAALAQTAPEPDVHADRTITFKVNAPNAKEEALCFGSEQRLYDPGAPRKPRALTREASGLWSITIGPVAPEIYEYTFLIDGIETWDSANPHVLSTAGLKFNFVEVPGNPPRFDEVQNVPHGAIHIRSYLSTPLKQPQGLYIYLPPNYDSEPSRRYPILNLRHGATDDESGWSQLGRAGVILDNLIAQRKAVPMIIVMTNGTPHNAGQRNSMDILAEELLDDVVPFVEKNYRVLPGRENRAIAGLSMGAWQSINIGLNHLDKFAWVGAFSSGVITNPGFDLDQYVPHFLSRPDEVNRQLKLLFLSCGTEDPRYGADMSLGNVLTQHRISHVWYPTPGVHEFRVWRHSLYEFAQRLFRA